MLKISRYTATFFLSVLIYGCGGGGGGTSSSTPNTATYSFTEATAVPISALTLGMPHADADAPPYGSGTISLAAGIASSSYSDLKGSYPAIDYTFQFFPADHLTSDLITKVWANGWNGYGQSISIIDDFQSSMNYDSQFHVQRTTTDLRTEPDPVTRAFVTNTYVGNYLVDYGYTINSTHGATVSNIAAADGQGAVLQTVLTVTPYAANPVSCSMNSAPANTTACGNTSAAGDNNPFFGAQYSAWQALVSAPVSYHKVAGIAKSASVIENDVNLSPMQDPYTTSTYISGDIDNSYQAAAINLSLGTDINTAGISLATIFDDINKNPKLTKKSEAVITVAAGNSSGPCGATDLAGCNYFAAYLAMAPQTKESVLVVGATTGTGANEKMATYSTRAGALASRFIIASGDTGVPGVVGTSFAAPRVAAAVAIVRQKYPHLTATQVANLLLLTASKDINNDGIDDFQGVSSIYGYGKLDLVKALSPLGTAAISQ